MFAALLVMSGDPELFYFLLEYDTIKAYSVNQLKLKNGAIK